MTANGFTPADPNDRGRPDVAGFDTTAPVTALIRNPPDVPAWNLFLR
jgi:hypothetical protein